MPRFLDRVCPQNNRLLLTILVAAGLQWLPPGALGQGILSLHDAVTLATASPRARVAEERVNLSRSQRVQAGLGINPRLTLQSEDLRPWASDFSFANKTEDYGYLSQTFEVAGKRARRVALADANIHTALAQRSLEVRQITGSVAAAYWTAVADQRIAEALKQDLTAVDAMVTYHQARVDAGAMRGVDLIRIEIERDRLSLSLAAAERDAELARTDLFRQIGSTTSHDVVLTDDLTATAALPTIDLATALSQRPELTVARDQIAAAQADLKLQQANAHPDPDLFGGYKRNSGADTGYVALQIPLALRNRNQGEIARTQAQLRIAEEQLRQVEVTVELELRAATENYRRELAIVNDILPRMREHARQNLGIETEAYQLGGVDLLRYLDAERTAYDVEVTAIRTLADFHQAQVRLLLAGGGQP